MVDVDKIAWNARVRRNELYYRGLQYLTYMPSGTGLADYQPISLSQPMNLTTNGINDNSALYDYVLNFFQGDVDTFIAVLGGRSPNVQAQARDLANMDQVGRKIKADRTAAWLYSHWNIEELHPQLIRGIALYGTMFGYARYVTDPSRYGTSAQQSFSVAQVALGDAYYQCPYCGTETPAAMANSIGGMQGMGASCARCGHPLGPESLVQPESMATLVPNAVTHTPNGSVELTLCNPAMITAPTWCRDLDHAPWMIYETEEEKGALIRAYPELREKLYSETYGVDGDAAKAMGAYTRNLITSPAGYVTDRNKNRLLHTLLWMAPTSYEYLDGDRDGTLRDFLMDKFPDGFRVPMVNGELIPNRMMDERMTSVMSVCKPKPSEMIYADPYFDCMIQMQDCVNDSVSMIIEQAERSNPFVIADPEILNPDMLREFANVPGEFKFAKPGSVGSLDKGFFRVPSAELDPMLINFIDKYVGWCREITGIVPAVFGAAQQGPEQTAREAEIRRNQALMKLSMPWNQVRNFWAQTYENGIYQAAKYSGGQMFSRSSQGNVENTEIDGIWDLARGGFYMRCEESMPETIAQRRDWVFNVLHMPPQVQAGLGLKDPNNICKIQEAIGVSDWSTPGYQEIMRLQDIIAQLKSASPLPGMPDPMTGQPGPPQPSIPFDSFLFDPQLALQTVKEYLLGDDAKTLGMENPAGLANVTAFAHSIQLPPAAPPPAPPKMSISANLSDMTPEAQQAIMKDFSVPMPPGQIAMPKTQQEVVRDVSLAEQGLHPSQTEMAKTEHAAAIGQVPPGVKIGGTPESGAQGGLQ